MANWKFYLDGNQVEEPIGWDGIEFTAIRMESHGIDQPFSTEVKFYAEGAKYIKSIYDQYFINQPIAIQIVSDVGYNGSPYQFDGFLNLAIYQEHNVCDTDTFEITVGIIDDDFREKFKARQDVELNLNNDKDLDGAAIDPLTFKNIRLHRQDLYLIASGKNYNSFTGDLYNGPLGPNAQEFVLVPTYWQSSDFTQQYGSTFNTTVSTYTGVGNFGNSPIFQNNGPDGRVIQYSITISFSVTNNDTGNANDFGLSLYQVSGNVPQAFPPSVVLVQDTVAAGATNNYNNTYTGSFTIDSGIKVTLIFIQDTFSTVNPGMTVTIDDGYTINFTELNSGEYASQCNVLTIEQWLRRCIYMMTGQDNMLLSDAFSEADDGCYWNNALTNGTRIRGIDPFFGFNQLSTSWKQVFDGLDRIFCLGWAFEWTGTDWKIRVEPREYFLPKPNITDLYQCRRGRPIC